jgi:hypothetical protein
MPRLTSTEYKGGVKSPAKRMREKPAVVNGASRSETNRTATC